MEKIKYCYYKNNNIELNKQIYKYNIMQFAPKRLLFLLIQKHIPYNLQYDLHNFKLPSLSIDQKSQYIKGFIQNYIQQNIEDFKNIKDNSSFDTLKLLELELERFIE